MVDSDRFRTQASECIKAANAATAPERKLVLFELAQRWLDLATQTDALYERFTPRGDIFLDRPNRRLP